MKVLEMWVDCCATNGSPFWMLPWAPVPAVWAARRTSAHTRDHTRGEKKKNEKKKPRSGHERTTRSPPNGEQTAAFACIAVKWKTSQFLFWVICFFLSTLWGKGNFYKAPALDDLKDCMAGVELENDAAKSGKIRPYFPFRRSQKWKSKGSILKNLLSFNVKVMF